MYSEHVVFWLQPIWFDDRHTRRDTVLPNQSIFILSLPSGKYFDCYLRAAAGQDREWNSTFLLAAMASALLQCALTGRPVIAKPAVFQRSSARRVSVYARERPQVWYPNAEPPEYLDGSTPGDFG